MWIIKLLGLLLIAQCGGASKILGVFHVPVRSHYILGSTLLKALADKGHQVTMLSPFTLDTPYPNYKDIELTGARRILEDPQFRKAFLEGNSFFNFNAMKRMQQYLYEINEFTLNHTAVTQLISSKEKFDAVIQVYFGNDVHLSLAHSLEAYSIIFSPVGSFEIINEIVRNPAPYAYTPTIILGYPNVMDFWQRVKNVLGSTALQIFALINEQKQDTLLNKYIPGSPSVRDLRNNVSLILLNSHFAFEGSRAYLPNIIQIGGFHVKPPNELAGEIKEYMDSATEGVILFSLGSNVKSSELSEHKIREIVRTFSVLPHKILWKFEDSTRIPIIPPNVKISKWIPQRDVLAHQNIKVFITHGGLLSTTEALYNGVPMVGIPMYGDQIANVNAAVDKGIAIKVELNELSYETLRWAVEEVTENPRYRQVVQTLSTILKDNPISPLDKATYWIEYVIKHKGARHLKSAAMSLEWYQLNSLDVFGFLLGTLLLAILGLFYIPIKIVLSLLVVIIAAVVFYI